MWVKKNKEFKGKNYYYSLKNKLRKENKIDSNFELILNNLTLEELIGLKLELSSEYINNKLYNFPLYKSIKYIIKESLLIFALSSTRTTKDAASLLGVRERDLLEDIKKFKLKISECTYDETN